MAELVTGYAGVPHISSDEAGRGWAGIVGVGSYVMPTAQQLECQVQSANSVSVAPGDAFFNGRHVTVSTTEVLTIDNGAQDMQRNDIVCFHYTKDAGTGVEAVTLEVIKGTPGSTAVDPTIPAGDILAGANDAYMPLWRIPLVELTIGTPVQLFATVESLDSLTAGELQRVKFASGVELSDTSSGLYITSPEDGQISQAQWRFLKSGEMSYRVRTRPTVGDSWGAWSAAVGITAQELERITVATTEAGLNVGTTASVTLDSGLVRFMVTSTGLLRLDKRVSTSAAWETVGYAPVSGNSTVSANRVFAGPASGGSDTVRWRSLVSDDIPNLAASKITSGRFDNARMPTNPSFTTIQMGGDFNLKNGGVIWDNAAGNIHFITPEDNMTAQAEYTFEPTGVYSRTRTRPSASSAWGAWSGWTKIAG